MGLKGRLLGVGALALLLALVYLLVDVGPNWEYVLPRRALKIFAVLLTGTSIAGATVIFQTITNNRILTPSIIGMDSLYVLLQTFVVFVFGATSALWVNANVHFALSAGLMAMLAGILYQAIFRREQQNIYVILLIGLILGVFFQSFASFLQMLIDPNEFSVLQGRMFGSFNSVRQDLMLLATLLILLVFGLLAPYLKFLDVLALGRDHAVNLGVTYPVVVKRLWIVIAALIAVSTALVGPITFLGLLVANLAYEIFRTHRHAVLIPGAVLLGITALLGALIVVERVFTFSTTVSVVVDFVGSVYFLYIVLRESQR